MAAARDPRLVAATLALATTLSGCALFQWLIDPRHMKERREACKKAFTACAPPGTFPTSANVETLTPRRLVQAAARLDTPKDLAEQSAQLLLVRIPRADTRELEELDDAIAEAQVAFGPCACKDKGVLVSQLEKQRVADHLYLRIPPREMRSPDYWAQRVVSHLAAMREAARRSAEIALARNAAGEGEAAEGGPSDPERALCKTLADAHANLTKDGFADMLARVFRSSALGGEGSVEASRRRIEEMEASGACGGSPQPGR